MLRPLRANSMIRRRYSGAYGGWVRGIWKTPFPSPQHPLRNRVNSSAGVAKTVAETPYSIGYSELTSGTQPIDVWERA